MTQKGDFVTPAIDAIGAASELAAMRRQVDAVADALARPMREVQAAGEIMNSLNASTRVFEEVDKSIRALQAPALQAAALASLGRTLGMATGRLTELKKQESVPVIEKADEYEAALEKLGAAKTHRLPRDGARDLVFVGWKLGAGSVVGGKFDEGIDDGTYERETEVVVYLTEARNFVVHESRLRGWGAQRNDDVKIVLAKGDPKKMIPRERGRDPKSGAINIGMVPESDLPAEERLLETLQTAGMGPASRDAWNESCAKYEPLAHYATESLD